MAGGVNIKDLRPEDRKRLGLKTPRDQMTKDEVRSCALRAMAVIADRTQRERRRIIAHMAKLNDV